MTSEPSTRVLILGAGGMLGHALMSSLVGRDGVEVQGTARDVQALQGSLPDEVMSRLSTLADVRDLESVRRLLESIRPDIVVNCVGVIKQSPAVTDAVDTIKVNSLFPHQLAIECERLRSRLVHVSTDCVFSGNRGSYTEADIPDPVDLYGRSKLLGEVISSPALTLRTSIIGHEVGRHRSLVDWFLNQSGVVNGYTRAIYSGLTTGEFANLLASIVFPRPDLAGLFHVASSPISKYELLKLVASEYGWKGELVAYPDFVCDRSLSANAFFALTGYRSPAWPDMIAEMRGSAPATRIGQPAS